VIVVCFAGEEVFAFIEFVLPAIVLWDNLFPRLKSGAIVVELLLSFC